MRIALINHESVGHDEAFSITVSRLPPGEMMQALIRDFVHPPLHYIVLRGWMGLVGWGVFQARLLSVLFSVLAIPVLYVFGRLFFSRSTALIASLLLAVSQLTIMFSAEPRPYAQVLLLSLCSAYCFVVALQKRLLGWWCAFVGSGLAMLYTHYFGFFVILALLLFAFLYRRHYSIPWQWYAAGGCAILLAYAPWLVSGIVREAEHSGRTFSGVRSYWAVHWTTFFSTINTFNNGKPAGLLNSAPAWTFLVGGLLFAAPVCLGLWSTWNRRNTGKSSSTEGVVLVLLLFLAPVMAAIGLGFLHVQYNVRYVSFAAAPYYLLVAHGFSELRPGRVRWVVVVLALFYSAYSLRANFLMRWKEDFRGAYEIVSAKKKSGDCQVFLPYFSVPAEWTVTLAGDPSLPTLTQSDFVQGAKQCGRIWAISFAPGENPGWEARSQALRDQFAQQHARLLGARFFGVQADLYKQTSGQ